MRGIVVPPHEEDFTADPAELFFDLVFVFAFSRLVWHLVHHPDWTGVGEFALLYLMMWVPWTQFTWSANAVAGNSRSVRLVFLVATIASVPMAGSVTAALSDGGSGGATFAFSITVILAMALIVMILAFERASTFRRSIVRYSANNWMAAILIVIGGFAGRTPRIWLWIAAIAIVFVGTLTAGSSEWVVRPGHFAERHGLIAIVALGELIVALGAPVVAALDEHGELPAQTLVAIVAAGVFACLIWWSLFDRPLRALEHRHEQFDHPTERGRYARDVYTYSFMPIVAGILLCAAALEAVTLHPDRQLETPFRAMLAVGLALNVVGVGAAVGRAFGAVAIERVVAAAAIAVILAVGGDSVSALTLLIIVDVVLLLTLVVEHLRVEYRYRHELSEAA